MLSTEPRCIYRRSPLAEVICQLRFPEILTIEANLPADFQEAIRQDYPQFSRRQESPPPAVSGTPGHMNLEKKPPITNYQFVSADGHWRVNLTSRFISLSCSRYTSWEEFAKRLDKPLAAFIRLYQPAWFDRIGLRYLNFFSRRELALEEVPFRKLFQSWCLGPLVSEAVAENAVTRNNVDAELALRGGCRVRLHAGPGIVKRNNHPDPELKFVLDQDLFMIGKIPGSQSAGALQTLHSQAFALFRGAVTEALHEAMEPEYI